MTLSGSLRCGLERILADGAWPALAAVLAEPRPAAINSASS